MLQLFGLYLGATVYLNGTSLPTYPVVVASILSSTTFAVSDPSVVGGAYEYYNASAYTTAASSTVTQPVQSIFNESALNTAFTDMSSTPGNVTIATPSGAAAFSAGTSSITVTNPLVTLNSVILAVLQTADATMTGIRDVIPANGSFTINGNATATATTRVAFQAFNLLAS